MKKKIALTILSCFLLSACGNNTKSESDNKNYEGGRASYYIIKDELYGCEYIEGGGYSSPTPRLTKSGEQAGCVK